MDIPDHIQGLIFDCDGTLVDTPPLYAAAWMAALAEFGARLELAVASSGPAEIVQATLEATGLRPLFNEIVTIEDVANAKPAPDLFLEAARRLGLAPDSCLVFEDSAQGLQAALLAGMPAIDINKLMADTAPPPDGLNRVYLRKDL